MSAPGIASGIEDRLQMSHAQRLLFERAALAVFLSVTTIFLAIALAGVLWPPGAPHAADWGASIVQKAIALKDTVVSTLETLLAGLGISLGRGHMDARLSAKGDS